MNSDNGFEYSEQDDESYNPWGSAEQKALKAFELYESGQMNDALVAMNEALDINPANDRWHFNKALTLDAMERFDEAIAEYKLAIELNPNDIETLNCLAVDYTRSGQYDLALEVFGQIEKSAPDFEPSYCNRIITYTETGDYEMAEQMFYLAQQLNDKCPLCFYNIGNLFFIRGEYKRAAWCWERTALLEPSHPQINYRIAQACWNLGDRDLAYKKFIEELKSNPGDTDVIFDFGLFLLHSGNIASAAEKFNRILETQPDYAPAVFYLGEIELNKKNLPAAEEYYKKAIKLDSKLAGPRFRLGQIAFNRGSKDEAFSLLVSELELDVEQVEVLIPIGLIMLQMGQNDYAVHCFLKVSEIDSANAANYLHLADALARRGEEEDAQQFLDYAAELEPENYTLICDTAKAYLRMQNPQKALLMLSQCQREQLDLTGKLLKLSAKLEIFKTDVKERISFLLRRFRRR
ncbi:MAG: tetratricopeptide repeat protein [Phycisphaerae bacterium]|jgi:tetratricopeptide (TPR) repeat protein